MQTQKPLENYHHFAVTTTTYKVLNTVSIWLKKGDKYLYLVDPVDKLREVLGDHICDNLLSLGDVLDLEQATKELAFGANWETLDDIGANPDPLDGYYFQDYRTQTGAYLGDREDIACLRLACAGKAILEP